MVPVTRLTSAKLDSASPIVFVAKFGQFGVKVLIIDEIQHVLAVPLLRQWSFFNVIKHVGEEPATLLPKHTGP